MRRDVDERIERGEFLLRVWRGVRPWAAISAVGGWAWATGSCLVIGEAGGFLLAGVFLLLFLKVVARWMDRQRSEYGEAWVKRKETRCLVVGSACACLLALVTARTGDVKGLVFGLIFTCVSVSMYMKIHPGR